MDKMRYITTAVKTKLLQAAEMAQWLRVLAAPGIGGPCL